MRLRKGGQVLNLGRVEDHHVGVAAGPQEASVAQSHTRRNGGAHLADGILELNNVVLPDIAAQDARVGAVAARMGWSQLPRPGWVDAPGVGSDRDPRLPQLL